MADDAIHIRISPSLKKEILDLVDSGDYRDMTDFVTKAIRNQLDEEPFEKYNKVRAVMAGALEDKEDDLMRDAIFHMLLNNLKEPLLELLCDDDIKKAILELINE